MNSDADTIEFQAAQQAFVALKGLQGLWADEPQLRPVLLADIAAYIGGGSQAAEDEKRVAQAITSDLRVRRQFKQLLAQQVVATVPQEALAQDTAMADERQGDGFCLKFRTSRADASQVYVILELDTKLASADGQQYQLIAEPQDTVLRLPFPGLNKLRAQLIMLSDDERLGYLRDPKVELHLVRVI